MSEQNTQILLTSRPEGLPARDNFDVVQRPRPEPRDGEVLVRNVYLSLDPAMRGWMSDRKSYIPPVRLGDVMRGLTAGEVVASAHPGFNPGDRVTGSLGWQEYGVARGEAIYVRVCANACGTMKLMRWPLPSSWPYSVMTKRQMPLHPASF